MAKKFPRFKSGDELQPVHMNLIFSELDRLGKMTGAGTVTVRADGPEPPEIFGHTTIYNLIPCKTKSGGITVGSQSSPSTNSVTLLSLNTSGALVAGTDVNVLNYSTRVITGAGKLLWLAYLNGKLVVPFPDC